MTDNTTGVFCPLNSVVHSDAYLRTPKEVHIAQCAQAIREEMKRSADEAVEAIRPVAERVRALLTFRSTAPDKGGKAEALAALAKDIGQPPRARARRADEESLSAEHRRIVFETALAVVPRLSGTVRLPQAMKAVQDATNSAYSASRREDRWMGAADIKVKLDTRAKELTGRKTVRIARYGHQDDAGYDTGVLPLTEDMVDIRRHLGLLWERLSAQERQCLVLVSRGFADGEIASELQIRQAQVRQVRSRAKKKAEALSLL